MILVAGCGQKPTRAPETLPPAPDLVRTPAPIADHTNKMGIYLLLDDGRKHWPVERWAEHLRAAREIVGEWGFVVQLVRLDDLDAAKWQQFMDLCAALELTPVIRLATVYDQMAGYWIAPPQDADRTYRGVAQQYADFITALEWPTDEHWVIVGNEPNQGGEWGGKPDAAAYARFLIDVADTLHAVDPGARVLNGALDPYAPHTGDVALANGAMLLDAETFMDRMTAAYPGVWARIDVWASHSYPTGPFRNPPTDQTFQIDLINGAVNPAHDTPPEGIYNRGVQGYEWELFKLAALGAPTLPVLITETGWRHAETVNPGAADGGDDLPDAATVAGYLDQAWGVWGTDARVVGVVFFALDGNPAAWGHSNWLMVDERGRVVGRYYR